MNTMKVIPNDFGRCNAYALTEILAMKMKRLKIKDFRVVVVT